MIDPIQSASVSRLRPAEQTAPRQGAPTGRVQPPNPAGAAEEIALSEAATSAISKISEADAPFDADRVARIKEAISEGTYPVDAGRVTESFFRDFEALL